MGLREYRRKRDFARTPEPAGEAPKRRPGRKPAFVVQAHAARRMHYDFRLELDGVLKSWAVPKGPSLDPAQKRLAVHVEDHPIEYGDFEGVIPRGEYGGGTVMLWDRGWWEPVGDAAAGYAKGDFKFILHGEKLRGKWVLVRMKQREGEKAENWLLIKEQDGEARPGSGTAVVEEQAESAATGRDMRAIAAEADRVWSSKAGSETTKRGSARAKQPRGKRAAIDVAAIAGARRAKPLPEISPQLASTAERAPAGDDWLHEIKFDGYRMLARLENGKVALLSRNDLDWTERFPEIAAALAELPAAAALLDGEVVHVTANGVTSFSALQNDLSEGTTGGLVYMAFDLLHLDGWSLTEAALEDRKRALAALLASDPASRLRYGDHQLGKGAAFFDAACRLGLEGIVSKRRDAPYRAGRSTAWLKVKCGEREELVVVGFTDAAGARSGFGALLMGYYRPDGKLVYAGRVGTGFSEKVLEALRAELDRLERKPPTVALPEGLSTRGVHWVEPKLVAEVTFAAWTSDAILRESSFVGLREDKASEDVILAPKPGRSAGRRSIETPAPTVARDGAAVVQGVRISNAERMVYPALGISKLAVAEYYAGIADLMLPHVRRRPLSLVRCPEGMAGECFFQKHLTPGFPEAIRQIPIKTKEGRETYAMIEDAPGLIGLAQMGVLEIHPWGSTIDRLEQPDRLIFDLDPDTGLAWERVIAAALTVRDTLEGLGLRSFAKTTGGKGLHVVVPLKPALDWDAAKEFSRKLVARLAEKEPQLYTASMAKQARRGRIFIDYLRNGRGATAVAAYSTRARPAATVSAPLAWEEVENGVRSDHFTILNLMPRLRSGADPWRDFAATKQAISAGARRMLGV
jgi:bifunctional non-homologous end joining protein LigD